MALEACRLELAALGPGRLLLFNLRLNWPASLWALARARIAAGPVFQIIFLYMFDWYPVVISKNS